MPEKDPLLLLAQAASNEPAALVFPPGGTRRLFEAQAQSASSPLAAAFLLGLTVPRQHAERIADLVMSRRGAPPIEGIAGDDGSRAWEWDADGVFLVLRAFDDGHSDAYCRADAAGESDG